jgi:hypothetical protein
VTASVLCVVLWRQWLLFMVRRVSPTVQLLLLLLPPPSHPPSPPLYYSPDVHRAAGCACTVFGFFIIRYK